MYHVYLAGPISGLSYESCTDWRQQFAQLLMFEKDVRCLSPMRGKEYLAREERVQHCYPEKVLSCERGIMTRDFFDAQRSDLVVAHLLGATAVSVGTVMEIAWAYQARTPVIAIMEPSGNPHDHPMVREAIGFRVETLRDAVHTARMVLWP